MKTTNGRTVPLMNATDIALYAAGINEVLREVETQNGTITYKDLATRIGLCKEWNCNARNQLFALLDVASAIAALSKVKDDVVQASFKRVVAQSSGEPGAGVKARPRIIIEWPDDDAEPQLA